jgi:hypothetical protein
MICFHGLECHKSQSSLFNHEHKSSLMRCAQLPRAICRHEKVILPRREYKRRDRLCCFASSCSGERDEYLRLLVGISVENHKGEAVWKEGSKAGQQDFDRCRSL